LLDSRFKGLGFRSLVLRPRSGVVWCYIGPRSGMVWCKSGVVCCYCMQAWCGLVLFDQGLVCSVVIACKSGVVWCYLTKVWCCLVLLDQGLVWSGVIPL
jgi:hypothetical protein